MRDDQVVPFPFRVSECRLVHVVGVG
jgi:hypothetical protein